MRRTDSALRFGTWSAKSDEPYVVTSPSVSNRSLTATGVPGPTSSGRASQIPSTGTRLVLFLLGFRLLVRGLLLRRLDSHRDRERRPRDLAVARGRAEREDVLHGRRPAERLEEAGRKGERDDVLAGDERPLAEIERAERRVERALLVRGDDELELLRRRGKREEE